MREYEYGAVVVSGTENGPVTGPFMPGGVVEIARQDAGWFWAAYGVNNAGEWFDYGPFGPFRTEKRTLEDAYRYLYT